MNKIVLAVERSQNTKIGPVSATYAPIHSCPKTCPFLDKGCYAQTSFTGMHLRELNRNAEAQGKTTPESIAKVEAREIQRLSGKRPLRLHVVGDCRTTKSTEIILSSVEQYQSVDDQPIWTYTHAWREIPRDKWGCISVLASCESVAECKEAIRHGYAASMVAPEEFSKTFQCDGLRMTACLELTKGIQCVKCRKCFNDQKLSRENRVICFFPHGSGANKIRSVLEKGKE